MPRRQQRGITFSFERGMIHLRANLLFSHRNLAFALMLISLLICSVSTMNDETRKFVLELLEKLIQLSAAK